VFSNLLGLAIHSKASATLFATAECKVFIARLTDRTSSS
jgi:hypothetical protein